MTTIQAGDFWVAEIPFTSGAASKKRPVLILWIDGQDVVVAAVAPAQPRTLTDVAIVDWQAGGLRVASTVRLARLDCLENSLLLAKIGQLSASDAKKIKQVWQLHVKPRF
jgi:mRNA interferase MazF